MMMKLSYFRVLRGLVPEERIVGGVITAPHEFPSIISFESYTGSGNWIEDLLDNTGQWFHFCAGSIFQAVNLTLQFRNTV